MQTKQEFGMGVSMAMWAVKRPITTLMIFV